MNATRRLIRGRRLQSIIVVPLAVAAFLVPTIAVAASEQNVITLVDEPAPWEFDDPCTGEAVHGVGVESGVARITDLGDQGHHLRLNLDGVADLYDANDRRIGTWTHRIVMTDQFPPDGQGAVHLTASGPLVYADGRAVVLHVYHHHVFAKGDEERKPARDTASCGGSK